MATRQWGIGANGTFDFNNPANWAFGVVPDAIDIAQLNTGAVDTITGNATIAEILASQGDYALAGTYTISGAQPTELSVTAGGIAADILTILPGALINGNQAVSVSGATALLNVQGGLIASSLNVASGAVFVYQGSSLVLNGAISLSGGLLVGRAAPNQAPGPAFAIGSAIQTSGAVSLGSYDGQETDFNGLISGSGAVTLAGDGLGDTVGFNGANTYTGGTTLSTANLTLALGNASALGTGKLTMTAGELLASATETIANQLALSGNFTIAAAHGQILTLSSSQPWALGATIGEVISFGAPGQDGVVVFKDTGSAIISAPGTDTVTVRAGTLAAGDGGVSFLLSNTLATVVQSGAAIDAAGFALSVVALQGGGQVIDSGAATTLSLVGAGNFAGVISGPLAVTISSGTTILSGANTYAGGTTIASGATLTLGAGGSVAGNIVDNGLVRFVSVTTANTFSGSGSAEAAAGTVVVTGASAVSGTVTIDFGATMQWGAGNSAFLVGASNAVVDNGALVMNFGGGGIGGAIPISGPGSVEIQSGALTQSGAATYTGVTTIDAAGFLNLSGTGSIANSSNVIVNGTLDISGETAGTSIRTLAGSGGVSLGAQTLTLTNASGTFGGVLADGGLFGGTGGGLTIAGGNETLTGANTYTGATTINGAGTLILGAGGSVAGNIVDNGLVRFVSVTTANTFSGSGSAEAAAGTVVVTGASAVSGTVTIDFGATMQWGAGNSAFLVGASNAVVDNGALVMNFGGGGIGGAIPISGTGSVTITSGALTEGGASTFTGVTTLNPGGVLALSGTGSIANSSNVIVNGTLDISGVTAGTSIRTLAGSGGVSLGGQTLTLTNASGTFGGVLADGGLFGGTGGGLTIAGGTETLTGTNTYTGATTINGAGTLTLGAGGSVAGAITDNGTLAINRSDTFALNNVSGTGRVVQSGAGTTLLGSGLSYSGGTVINAGVLSVGSAIALGSGALTIAGGELLASATETIANQLLMSGNFTIAAAHGQTLTIPSSQPWHLSASAREIINFGAPGQDGVVVFNDTSGTSISGVGTYTVDVQAGTLKAGNSGLAFLLGDDLATIVQSGATIDAAGNGLQVDGLEGAGRVTDSGAAATLFLAGADFAGLIDGAFALQVFGSVTLTGADTYTGGTTILGGAELTLGNGGATGSVAGNIADNGTLEFHLSGPMVESGVITGSGNLVQDGSGTTVLTQTSSYTGGTLLGGGGLELQQPGSAGSGTITFLNGTTTTLQIDGTSMPSNQIIGFNAGDAVDLSNVVGTGWSYSGGVFSLLNGSTTVALLNLSTPFAHPDFGVASDGVHGTIIHLEPPPADFTGNGFSGLLWQNNDGTPAIWEVNGTSVLASAQFGNPGSAWRLVGTGDFNGDGTSDLLYQNSDGTAFIWEMNGTNIIGGGPVGNPGASWRLVGTGDFNGDGKSDLLWQNSDGTAFTWELNGTSIIGGGTMGNPGPTWRLVGTGDFNGDGKSDLLWQNSDGTPFVWEMNGTTTIGGGPVGNPGASWHLIGTGDFNGDGKSDLLWQNNDGTVAIWEMNGTSVLASVQVGNPGSSWHLIGAGDYNGDGKSDLLFQNSDGTPFIWEMNGTNIIGGGPLGDPGSSWHLIPGL